MGYRAVRRSLKPALFSGQPLLPRQVLAEDFSLLVLARKPGTVPRQARGQAPVTRH